MFLENIYELYKFYVENYGNLIRTLTLTPPD